MKCPLVVNDGWVKNEGCKRKKCAWWCDGEDACAVKAIALQMIKIEEVAI